MPFPVPSSDVISVATLNRMARDLLESGLPAVWISGEISNLTLAASGHAYFSLKEGGAQVRCVMFRHKLAPLAFRLKEGMQVELKGLVTLYEARGDFQISVDTLRSAGLGRLFEAFERLKAQLAAEGLFDEIRKRALPLHPARIGIVTSPQAAALRDVLTTLRRRMPSIPVILYPTPVQGADAAGKIAAAIRTASERQEVDVLIVCRGGGSIEDLWSFNEEVVARAIAGCSMPVVSGVGHETDFTICDFVADRRAPTPTAAAEMVSPDREQALRMLEQQRRALERALMRLLTDKGQRLDYLSRRLLHPGDMLARQRQQLADTRRRLDRAMERTVSERRFALQRLDDRLLHRRPDTARAAGQLARCSTALAHAMQMRLSDLHNRIDRCRTALDAMNPEAVLARGYAIVEKGDGRAARSPAELAQNEVVTLHLAQGRTRARIDHPAGAQPELPF